MVVAPVRSRSVTEVSRMVSVPTTTNDAELAAKHPGRFTAVVSLPLPHIDAALREMPTTAATSRKVTEDRDGGRFVGGMRRPDLVGGVDRHRDVVASVKGSGPRQRLAVDSSASQRAAAMAAPRKGPGMLKRFSISSEALRTKSREAMSTQNRELTF